MGDQQPSSNKSKEVSESARRSQVMINALFKYDVLRGARWSGSRD